MTLLARRLEWQRRARPEAPELRVVLLSTFTVDSLVPYLGMALAESGIEADIAVGPYGQVMQQCLDAGSETSRARPDIVVVWPRLEDLWAARPLPLDDDPSGYAEDLLAMVDATGSVTTSGATVLFVLPAIPEMRPLGVGDANNVHGVFAVATAAREAARARLAALPGALVADAEEVVRELGSASTVDWRRCAVARIPYQETAFDAIGRRLARLVHLEKRGAAKVAAVDADQTLWGRIVGEVGVDQIDLFDNGPGEAHREFQRYLVELQRAGLLLTVVSKNDPDVVWEAFGRPEMVVQQSDLATSRVSWDEKADSITAIADELNLGTASIVLVDDSPIECEKVTFQLPEVRALLMPEDAVGWFDVIGRSGAFDRLPPTDTDRMRAASYQQEAQRRVLRDETSMEAFLASLELRVEIRELDVADVPRVAQLISKTNQFTLGGMRRSEAEVAAIVDDHRFAGYAVSASDRFGDYGTVGALVIDRSPAGLDLPSGAAVLDTFVLSCRAMGRGVETAMLASTFDTAGSVWTTIEESARNQPARDFFAGHGCASVGEPSELERPAWPAHINTD
ncbi:MAG TPA: HAD-IIIC family phosphatase [Acidimicrobiales bacterium]|nr:HAD-IIIC family phosphatase [Acidimicrobiales bacterium]